MKLLWLAALAVVGWRLLTGRWPWDGPRSAAGDATRLLGLSAGADREQIIAAHRALIMRVHPDRGGTSAEVHAADAARDLLLAKASRAGR
jgi:DnaJ family protein C protein 19